MKNGYLSLRGIEKSCIINRNKVFSNLSELIKKINTYESMLFGIKFETRTEYAIEYIEEIVEKYKKILNTDESKFLYAKGKNYGRTEEIYECESCENCLHKRNVVQKLKTTIRLNRKLTLIHK